jgi:hypothetical protein
MEVFAPAAVAHAHAEQQRHITQRSNEHRVIGVRKVSEMALK